MKSLVVMMALMLSASMVIAASSEKRIPTLKVGKCEITILDSNGIKPLSGVTLDLKNAENGTTAASAVANKSGLCEIKVAEGRYILSVDDKPITLVNATKEGQLAWARLVVSDSPMMVGGQEGATVATFTFMGLSGDAAVAAAVTAGIITVGAGGAIIYNEVEDDDDDDDDTTTPTTPTTAPTDDGSSPSGASS